MASWIKPEGLGRKTALARAFVLRFLIVWIMASPVVWIPAWGHAGSPEIAEPIRIVLNNWTSQILLSKIAGRIFETMGYRVAYSVQDSNEQWGALNRGKVHVQMEVWEGTSARIFKRMLDSGGVVDAGTHKAVTREDWWYPDYVEALCPGLPDWRALKRCAPIFAVPETAPFGRYLAGPWEKPDRARIRALGLKFKVIEISESDHLKEELVRAVKEKHPIVMFNWTPNWVEARYGGKFVEFPSYAPECETTPGWGINPEFHHDCGNPRSGWLKKAAWAGMERQWPSAFAVLKRISFNNQQISALALAVDFENKDPDVVADTWMDTHRALWKCWIQDGCR